MSKSSADGIKNPEMVIEGKGGQVELWANKVTIKHSGLLGKMTKGLTGDKDIYLSSITGIQLKRPTMITNGYIQFAFQGSQEGKGGIFSSTKDENTVLFSSKKRYKIAQQMKQRIEERMHQPQPSGPALSVADELTKLAALRDQGVISSKEFDQRKAAMLKN